MIGIYMMWFAALVSGFGALGMSIAYVIRPTERKLALMRPLSLASIFAAVCSFTHGLATVLRRSADPNSHPILKRLARFGPVDFLASRIEAELAAPHPTAGKLHLTSNWLVYATGANVLVTRYEDVAWVYKHVMSQRTYGITVSRTYSAMVRDRSGAQLQFAAGRKEQAANEMLQAILEHVPWAITGYTDELMRAWNKDRTGFLAAVDQRKNQPAQ